jgi:O-antigen ligase
VGLLPSHILQRLVTIRVPGSITVTAETNADDGSQAERTLLLEKAVRFAVTHPIFGTGPATFPDALWLDDVSHGTHTAALGTHNTYAQLAAEDGFPVLLLYLGALLGAIKLNYRVMKRTVGIASAEQVYTMAGCLLGSLIAYAIGTAFDHVAYSPTLPLLSGLSVSLYLASRGGNPQWIESQLREGNT